MLPDLKDPEDNLLKEDGDWAHYKYEESYPDRAVYSEIPFLIYDNPRNAWTMAVVTGHKYKLHWGTGIEKESVNIQRSEKWTTTDRDVLLHFNHS